MRHSYTFITHILFDELEPEILRGSLRSAAGDEVAHFNSQQELIALFREMMSHPIMDTRSETEKEVQLTNCSIKREKFGRKDISNET